MMRNSGCLILSESFGMWICDLFYQTPARGEARRRPSAAWWARTWGPAKGMHFGATPQELHPTTCKGRRGTPPWIGSKWTTATSTGMQVPAWQSPWVQAGARVERPAGFPARVCGQRAGALPLCRKASISDFGSCCCCCSAQERGTAIVGHNSILVARVHLRVDGIGVPKWFRRGWSRGLWLDKSF